MINRRSFLQKTTATSLALGSGLCFGKTTYARSKKPNTVMNIQALQQYARNRIEYFDYGCTPFKTTVYHPTKKELEINVKEITNVNNQEVWVPMCEMGNVIDWEKEHHEESYGKSLDILIKSFQRKIWKDQWHTLLASGEKLAGVPTTLSELQLYGERRGDGGLICPYTHYCIGSDWADEMGLLNKDILKTWEHKTVFSRHGVKIHILDELSLGNIFDIYYKEHFGNDVKNNIGIAFRDMNNRFNTYIPSTHRFALHYDNRTKDRNGFCAGMRYGTISDTNIRQDDQYKHCGPIQIFEKTMIPQRKSL